MSQLLDNETITSKLLVDEKDESLSLRSTCRNGKFGNKQQELDKNESCDEIEIRNLLLNSEKG